MKTVEVSRRPLGAKSTPPPLNDPQITVREGHVMAQDGAKLFFCEEGPKNPVSDRTLVFCYGLVCSALHWTYQIEHFRKTHRCIWFDYRGHQNSEKPRDFSTLSLEQFGDDLHLILQTVEAKNTVLLGHSMGVNVVLEYWRKHPETIRALVLSNGTLRRPLETLFDSNAMEKVFAVLGKVYDFSPSVVRGLWKLQKGNRLVHSLIQLGGFNPFLTSSEDVARYVDQVADIDPGVLLTLMKSYDHWDATPWAHELQIPTLIIAGEYDKVIPLAQQKLMAQLIPHSQFLEIPAGSHCPQIDDPDFISNEIESFLNQLT